MIQWEQLSDYRLNCEEIHIWLIDINEHDFNILIYQELLNQDEQIRANRFKFKKDRNCFVITRASLKILLSKYLDCLPSSISFKINSYGKPEICVPKSSLINFNLSHSSNLTLIAIAREQEIGVDIEYMSNRFSMDEIANRFFSKREVEEYNLLPVNQRLRGFYNAWTRKEAFIKAIGKGMSYPLTQFDVSLDPNTDASLIAIENDQDKASDWHLIGFTPRENYIAAISWKGNDKKIIGQLLNSVMQIEA